MTKDANPHFSFWIIASAGLVWNLIGFMNFIVQSNPASVAQMPEIYQVIISGRPAWATAATVVSVFAGAVGCILLLLRKSVAVPVLVLSLLGVAFTAVFNVAVFGLTPPTILSILAGGALLWYASIMRRAGWLHS